MIDAGADLSVALPDSAGLSGTATDTSPLTSLWTKESEPGAVTFGYSSPLDTTAEFSAPGTYVLRLIASDGSVSTSEDVAVTVSGSGALTFSTWIAGFTIAPGKSGENDDADDDGEVNLLEYGFDTDPTAGTPDTGYSLAYSANGDSLSITIVRQRPEIDYFVETSTTLDNDWTVIATNPGIIGEVTTVSSPPSDPRDPRKFMRNRISA